MITVLQAKEILFDKVKLLPSKTILVAESLGYVLAEAIYSGIDLPLFDQSAVDGYAINCELKINLNKNLVFEVLYEIQAGDAVQKKLQKNKALRIFTGAPIPVGTKMVVMQEKVLHQKNEITVHSNFLLPGSNIRKQGTQIKKRALALEKGTVLNPGTIGFLSSLGITHIKVWPKPAVSILSTGNELISAGKKLQSGQIYESNTLMLNAALNQSGFEVIACKSARDQKTVIRNRLNKMLESSDVVIVTGGISVGKYDLVRDILLQLGVKELFYKVSQKPGKPLFAGKLKDKIIFALPGNPAAALVCFYEYVFPVLRKMSGIQNYELQKFALPLTRAYQMKGDRDVFLKAKKTALSVTILEGQESNILKSFAETNALVYIPAGNRIISKGEKVETHLLPD